MTSCFVKSIALFAEYWDKWVNVTHDSGNFPAPSLLWWWYKTFSKFCQQDCWSYRTFHAAWLTPRITAVCDVHTYDDVSVSKVHLPPSWIFTGISVRASTMTEVQPWIMATVDGVLSIIPFIRTQTGALSVCNIACKPGPRLNRKSVFSRYGIPMLKTRRSRDRLIFNMGISILVRRHLYIETVPCTPHQINVLLTTAITHNGIMEYSILMYDW